MRTRLVLCLSFALFASSNVLGQIPSKISYQGVLNENNVSANGSYSMQFALFESSSGGSAIWSESQTVPVVAGVFNVLLGAITPLPSTLAFNVPYWLQVTVSGTVLPRMELTSSAYSFNTGRIQGRLVSTASPTSGQVLKWDGTQWAPAPDATTGGAAGGDLSGSFPNPTVAKIQTRNVSSTTPATGEVLKWTGSQWAPGTDETGGGLALPFSGTASTSGNAFFVENPGSGLAVVGWASASTGYTYGVFGHSSSSNGSGVGGEALATSGTTYGVFGGSASSTGYGVYGNAASTSGANYGVYGKTRSSSGTGVYGEHVSGSYGFLARSGYGVYGYAPGTGSGVGVAGSATSQYGYGLSGKNTNSSGTGIMGIGNNLSSYSSMTTGCGGTFNGTVYGVAGFAQNTTGLRAGGYFQSSSGTYAMVAAVTSAGTLRKIEGSGTMNTVMNTRGGNKTLFAPESPEAWFEDVGRSQLAGGHVRVDLDPLFLDCITVNESMPMNVFIQLNDDCNGVFVNTDGTGFDVHELKGGTSNARFSYRVIAKWKGYESERFPSPINPTNAVVNTKVSNYETQ